MSMISQVPAASSAGLSNAGAIARAAAALAETSAAANLAGAALRDASAGAKPPPNGIDVKA